LKHKILVVQNISKSHTKYIQSLHQKKFRDKENVFIAEGPKLIGELLQSSALVCTALYATAEWYAAFEHITEGAAIPSCLVKDFELEKISALATPHMVLGVFKKPVARPPADTGNNIILALDTIQDPGNMGTIIRLADWFGIKDIVCSQDSADAFSPKAVQSTMASIARVNIFYTDLSDWLSRQKKETLYAATLDGKNVTQMKPINQGVIIIGNEANGIHKKNLDMAAEKITIPKFGKAESLNAAVAAGIILSHLK
jgi:RNA methyltransferase, TrmH family